MEATAQRQGTGRKARYVRRALALVFGLVGLAITAPSAHAVKQDERAFNWSGYRWTVRSTQQRENPGHNRWGDTRTNARVRSDKTLALNISGGKSVEIHGPSTGYGTYRWVVRTDMSTIDPFRVAAFFIYGNGGEQDVEFARWGDPLVDTGGSWVTWRRRTRLGFGFFKVSPAAPYTIEIDWRVGATRFAMHDASGATLLDRTFPSSAPGRQAAPRMSYWVYPGDGRNLSPFTSASVHPPVIVESFRYATLRR
jgi:hypothetical protein